MALNPEQLKQAQALLDKINASYTKLGKTDPFKNFDLSKANDFDATIGQLNAGLNDVNKQLEDMNSELDNIVGAFKLTVQEISKSNTALNSQKKTFNDISKIATQLRNDQAGIEELTTKDLNNLVTKLNKKKQELRDNDAILKQRKQDLIDQNKSLGNSNAELAQKKKNREEINLINNSIAAGNAEMKDGEGLSERLLKIAKERLKEEKNIEGALGLGGAAIQGVGKVLDKIGLGGLAGRLGLDEAQEEMKKVAKEVTKGGKAAAGFAGQMKVLSTGTAVLGANLAKNLVDPLAVVGTLASKFVSAIKNADKNIEGIARGMNMTVDESQQFVKELNNAAIQSGSYKVNTKALVQANLDINNALGTSVKLNDKNLKTFVKFQNAAGLTSAELMGIKSLAIATGGDLEKMTGEFMAQAKITATQNKAVLNEKELLKDISNTSAAIKLSFGGSTKELAKAAATAKSLGMELGKVEDIAGSLLEFESSIEAELEAELLLGKNINLEKARQAALNNDLATVAEEIAKQAGSAADFANMNRIQQEAIASAVGMSRDELASSLFMQEQIGNLSEDEYKLREKQINELQAQGLSQDEIKEKLAKTSIEDLEAQAGLATKFHEASEKINDAFQRVAIALQPVFNMFAGIATFLAESKILAGGLIGALVAMKAVSAFIAIKTLITSVAKIFGENAKFGPFGIAASIAGVGAMIGAIAMATTKAKSVGDLAIPASGKTMISSKEGGLFELSPNDDVVAAPGAAAAVAGASGASSKRLEELQAQTNALLNKILSTQGTVSLDAEKMGTAISMNTYEISP